MAVKCLSEVISSSWTWPCLCVDSISSMSSTIKANTINASYFNTNINVGKRRLQFSNSFLDSCSAKILSSCISSSTKSHNKLNQRLIVVDELGGQYDDTFNDVKKELVNYFTFKAVRTVLEQLYEMNPPQYKWFNKISLIDNGHSFVADNVPSNGTRFLQILVKERRELAERVMITRLTLYGRWIKKCDHGEIYNEISEENLTLMRERLLETIQWPSDDNTKSDQETD